MNKPVVVWMAKYRAGIALTESERTERNEYNRLMYKRHREKTLARKKAQYAAAPEVFKARTSAYFENNRDEINKREREERKIKSAPRLAMEAKIKADKQADIDVKAEIKLSLKAARSTSIESGSIFYVGTPCKHGHGSTRYARCGGCVTCRSIASKKSRLSDLDESRRKGREYSKAHYISKKADTA